MKIQIPMFDGASSTNIDLEGTSAGFTRMIVTGLKGGHAIVDLDRETKEELINALRIL